MLRASARSTLRKPGPRITFLLLLPNVPGSGIWNAAVLKNRVAVGFEIFGFTIRSALLMIGLPVPAISALTIAESGVPDCNAPAACSCQPLRNAKRRPGML